MFEILKDLPAQIEAAKPHFRRGLTRADGYACRIIELLERIADSGSTVEDQRVKRFNLVNGAPSQLELPSGEEWKMVAMVVEPVGATTITLTLGGVRRFAKQFANADTPQIPEVLVSEGSTFELLSTGADAVVTIIGSVKRRRPKRKATNAGENNPYGLPANDGTVPTRHDTDEATELPPPPTMAEEIALGDEGLETIDRNAEPILP